MRQLAVDVVDVARGMSVAVAVVAGSASLFHAVFVAVHGEPAALLFAPCAVPGFGWAAWLAPKGGRHGPA